MGKDDEDTEKDVIEVSEKVAELMEMDEKDRVVYCKGVIMAVAKGFKEISQLNSKLAQARSLKDYLEELKENMEELRVAVFYTIKDEFRETYMELLEMLKDSF